MVHEPRKQSMARMETDSSKHTHFRWKIKWRLEHLGALGIMDKTAPTSGTKGKISFELKEMLSVRYFSLGRLFKYRVAYRSFLRLLQNPLCLKFSNMLWVELGLKSAHVYFTLLATSFSCGLLKTHSFHWRALGSLLTERRSWRAHRGRSEKGGIAIISLQVLPRFLAILVATFIARCSFDSQPFHC